MFGAAILVCQNDADVEFWADSSDNEEFASSDSDPEITDGVSGGRYAVKLA